MNERFLILSAKNPNMGCKSDENICETVKITAAIPIDIPILAAIKGIIGFRIPVYISLIKCPPESHTKARLFWDKLYVMLNIKLQTEKNCNMRAGCQILNTYDILINKRGYV